MPFSSIQQSSEIWTTPLSSTELSSTSITPKCMLSSPMTNRAQSRSTEVPPKCQLSYSVEQFRSTDRRQNAPYVYVFIYFYSAFFKSSQMTLHSIRCTLREHLDTSKGIAVYLASCLESNPRPRYYGATRGGATLPVFDGKLLTKTSTPSSLQLGLNLEPRVHCCSQRPTP